MPTPTAKDVGLHHWTGIDGYRFQLVLRQLGIEFSRAMLDANNLGNDVTKQRHGAYSYRLPLAGDVNANVEYALPVLAASSSQLTLIDAGKSPGDGGMIARGLIDSAAPDRQYNQLATFSTAFVTSEHEHVGISAVGTLANHWAPGVSAVTATANGTAIQLTEAVGAGEEIIFAWMEPDYPGPTAATTLTGDLYSATDEAFTTPVSRVTGLGSIAATYGVKSGIVTGSIATDQWWRVQWTMTGTGSRYPIAVFAKRPTAGYVTP